MSEAYLEGIGEVYVGEDEYDYQWGIYCQKEGSLWPHKTKANVLEDMSKECKPPDLLCYRKSEDHWIVLDPDNCDPIPAEKTPVEEGEWE